MKRALVLALLCSPACTGGDDGTDPPVQPETGPTCTEPTAVPCRDEVFPLLDMDLTKAAPGLITNTAGDGHILVDVDARAGGFEGTEGFVYARFTEAGLEKVDITDDESLDSLDWDIAFRRFVIRLNSGYAGPSCVSAARVPGSTFEAISDVPAGLDFQIEDTFIADPESCALVADGSGLPAAPGVVLQNWWTYPGCVATTYNPYVVSLRDGTPYKIVVDRFYKTLSEQENCNDNGVLSTGGFIQLRMAPL